MMITYSGLTKLKIKPIVYENVLLAHDSGTLEQLKELSTKRRAIEESINVSSNVTQAIAREMSGGHTYLPLLVNLVYHIDVKFKNHQTRTWISDLKIRWSSALASSPIFHLKGPKMYQVNDIHLELAMILSLHGAMLHERALELLSSDDLVQAATLFRRAAGVYDYLAREVLVPSSRVEDRPLEAQPCISCVMSLACLAEARAVAARKAEENGKSCGLLAKLHHGIIEFLVEAAGMLQATTRESKDVSSRLMDYIWSCKALHECKSHQYTAECLKKEGKIGVAVRVVRQTLSDMKKSMPKEESWRSIFRQVVDDLTAMLRKYEHENDFVWHDKVSCAPQGVKIVSLMPYQPQKWERTLVFKL